MPVGTRLVGRRDIQERFRELGAAGSQEKLRPSMQAWKVALLEKRRG
jgi:hypothetical protein